MNEKEQPQHKLNSPQGLKVLASKRVAVNSELYKIIDLCNRTLRERGIVFGLSKNGDEMTVTIYEA